MTNDPNIPDITVAAQLIDWAALREIAKDLAFFPNDEAETRIRWEIEEVLKEAAADFEAQGDILTEAHRDAIQKLMRKRMWDEIERARSARYIV